jgi:4-hydroxybenzoate polyprenyltransferase
VLWTDNVSEKLMKSFAKLAVAGISGVVLFKLFATLLFPLFGLMLGLFGMTVKLALIAAVVFFVYTMVRKRTTEEED